MRVVCVRFESFEEVRGRRRPRFGNRFRSTVWRRLRRRELKIAGEGSDDWAPPEAEDMVPDLTRRFRGTRSWRKSGKGRRIGARVGRRRLGGG